MLLQTGQMVGQIQVLLVDVLKVRNLSRILAAQEARHLKMHIHLRTYQQIRLIGHCALETRTVHLDKEQVQSSHQTTIIVEHLVLQDKSKHN